MKWAAPDSAWRTTNMSQCMASRLRKVSSCVSPLVVAEAVMLRLSTSADSRLAANSNVVRGRVLDSKNRLTTVLPRSRGTFFTVCSVTPAKDSARSRISTSSARFNPSTLRKWRSRPCGSSCKLRDIMRGVIPAAELGAVPSPAAFHAEAERHRTGELDVFGGCEVHVQPRHVGAHGQFAAAAVDQHRQHYAGGAAIVEDFVEGRADGAAGVEHVVDQHDVAIVHRERQLRGPHRGIEADTGEVVAVKRDVALAERFPHGEQSMEALRHPHAAAEYADHQRVAYAAAFEQLAEFGRHGGEQLFYVVIIVHDAACTDC